MESHDYYDEIRTSIRGWLDEGADPEDISNQVEDIITNLESEL